MDIEEVASKTPSKIITTKVDFENEISDADCEEIIKIFNSDSGKFINSKTHRLTKNKNVLIITRND